MKDKAYNYIKEIIREVIAEDGSTSGDAAPISTPKAFEKLNEHIIKEITYGKFKNEVKHRTKSEQLHKAIREVNRKITEIDRIIEYTSRMKQELSESEGGLQYWTRTEESIRGINELMSKVSDKLKNLS